MRGGWAQIAKGQLTAGIVLAVAVLAGGGMAVRTLLRRRPTQDEIERMRRASIHETGKIGSGEIIEVADSTIIYSYSVSGVGYTASQDLTALKSLLPADTFLMIGPVAVKFVPRNPANSIVLCEEWSGLQNRRLRKGAS